MAGPPRTCHAREDRGAWGSAGFLTAILTGDKAGLSEQASWNLSEAGLFHILAVFGMHCSFLLTLVRLLTGRHRRRLLAGVTVVLLVFYALLTGGSPSVVRACVMLIFLLAAPLLGRESDGPTSLLSALFFILLENPFAAASIGLQLSFGAVA
ncbi:MAG: ComEC/Rec2 family competence protein, partial [Oscillospiraceae bacterium]